MIKLLFDEEKPNYLKFVALHLRPQHYNILNLCEFATKYLMVTEHLSIYFSCFYNFEDEMDILFDILTKEGNRFTSINYMYFN